MTMFDTISDNAVDEIVTSIASDLKPILEQIQENENINASDTSEFFALIGANILADLLTETDLPSSEIKLIYEFGIKNFLRKIKDNIANTTNTGKNNSNKTLDNKTQNQELEKYKKLALTYKTRLNQHIQKTNEILDSPFRAFAYSLNRKYRKTLKPKIRYLKQKLLTYPGSTLIRIKNIFKRK